MYYFIADVYYLTVERIKTMEILRKHIELKAFL